MKRPFNIEAFRQTISAIYRLVKDVNIETIDENRFL